MTKEAAFLVLAAGLAAAAMLAGCSGDESAAARIERMAREGDADGLAREAQNPDADVSRMAVRALGGLGAKAVPQVEKALKDPRSEIREAAAIALPRVEKAKAARVLASVAKQDESASVRAAAATALGQIRAVDEVDTLLAALEDPDRTVRFRASAAMERIVSRRYEFYVDGTPEERHEAVEKFRAAWPAMRAEMRLLEEQVRAFRQGQPRPSGK